MRSIGCLLLTGWLTCVLATPVALAGASRHFDGAGDWVQADTDSGINAYPFTFMAWVKTDTNLGGVLVYVGDKDVSNVFWGLTVEATGGGAGTPTARMVARNTTIDDCIDTTVNLENAWHHLAAVFRSATDRELYVDGVSKCTDTSSVTMSSATDRTSMGHFGDSTPSDDLAGYLAEGKIYNRALSAAEVVAEMSNPGAVANGCVRWWSMHGPSPEPDLCGTGSGTVTNTTESSDGPPIGPPTVSITAPTKGAAVRQTVTVSANASDSEGIAGVQFKLDGANLGAEVTTSSYSVSWNTTTAAAGSHTLTAVAHDTTGHYTTSSPVTVTVDNTAPVVTITTPQNNDIIEAPVP